MKALPSKIKPRRGFSHAVHISFNLVLPFVFYVLVRTDFVTLAIALLCLSKWRMFAVRPRYWLANFRTNAIDILVGLSTLQLMVYANDSHPNFLLLFVLLYAVWLVWIKPKSSTGAVAMQAFIGLFASLTAFYLDFASATIAVHMAVTWLICYLCTRHFLSGFEESHAPLIANIWGFFGASLAWVLSHWLLFYGPVAQIAVIIAVIGYAAGALYYLDSAERLTPGLRRQFIAVALAILAIIVIFADWGNKTV